MRMKHALTTLHQGIRCKLPHHRLQLWCIPIMLAMLVSTILIVISFRRPFAQLYSVEAWLRHAVGVYDLEHTNDFAYAFTDGDALLTFPEVGSGRFVAALQLSSPPGTVAVSARIGTHAQQVDLSAVEQLRTYHLLLPASKEGHLRLGLTSGVQRIAPDPRPLGLVVGSIAVRAADAALPASFQLMTTLLALSLFWLALTPFRATVYRKAILLLLIGTLCGASYALTRGGVALQGRWIGLGTAAVVTMIVWRLESWERMTSRGGILLICVAWRVALWLFALAGLWLSEAVWRQWRGFSFSFGPPSSDLGSLTWRAGTVVWMNWDGAHYQAIAEAGYTFEGVPWPNIAFFPLYPLLMRTVMATANVSSSVAALLVSHAALLVAVLLLYDLLLHDFGRIVAYRANIFLLAFPTSFFFVAGYTESLALMLTVAAVWAMRRQRWWLTGVLGGLLAMTRVPGVLIAPVLGLVYLQHQQWRWRSLRLDLLAVLLPPLGLALFMLYQWRVFGTPWAFLIAQQSWQNGLAPPWVIPQQIVEELVKPSGWMQAALQLGVWIGVLALALAALRRLPLAYGLTGFLLILPAYFANIRDSLPRHVLISFPIFVVLAREEQPLWLRWLLLALLLPLLALLTMLYVNGFWIA
ncbi:MAG TPA: mannosyltransferase family protein [Herpetosiphonaceae bacterium]